jgi:hypothetical protein
VLSWAALAAGALSLPGAAAAAVSVSSNWAGYVALPSASVGSPFSSVSGSWTQPSATCAAGKEAYSAVWVGLGGYSESSGALEQVGTEANCTRSGSAAYSSWYELLPAAPVRIALKVKPGDQMAASATVRAHAVTLRVRDLSTGARFTKTLHTSNVSVSSAEWIVEAPSACQTASSCVTLPLTDFGTVAFSSATAIAKGHTGTVEDKSWSATALELRQGAGVLLRRPAARAPLGLTVATPSPPGSGGSFAVTWQQQLAPAGGTPVPTLPGFNGVRP